MNSPDQSFSAGELSFDQATSDYGAPEAVALGLIRFDELFGAHGLPEGAPISGAELRFWTTSSTTGPVGLHRMLVPWDGDTTWNSLGEGVAADDSEARAISDDSQADLQGNAYVIFDVTDSVQAWAEGAPNHGWLILNTSTDGWDVATELYEGDQATDRRPRLTVYYENADAHRIVGTEEADTLDGTDANDDIRGLGGDDIIRDLGGNDILSGGAGADRFVMGDAARNGVREQDTILDYEVGIDSLLLKEGAAITGLHIDRPRNDRAVIYLDGDQDKITIHGAGITPGNLRIIREDGSRYF